MKKILLMLLLAVNCGLIAQQKTNKSPKNNNMKENSIYNFVVKDINDMDLDFSKWKGKKIMIVNTASECGLTPQYEQLQKLYSEFKDQNFVIVGFPANDFGAQEPGSNQKIAQFCSQKYKVTFPMMSKISVKGAAMHPIYAFLTQKSKNNFADSDVEWNFQKYLIDENGHLVKVISPRTLPTDKEIVDWITAKK